MPLDIMQPPAESVSELGGALSKVSTNIDMASRAPRLVQAATMAVGEPGTTAAPTPALSSPVYVLGLDAIAAGSNLSDTRLALWTHFFPSTGDGETNVVAAEVNAETSQFSSLKEGPQINGFFRQVRALQDAPEMQQRSFELAELRVPALHVAAVWLKDKAGGDDVVIPVDPTNPALTPGERYSIADFCAALRPAAEAALAETDELKGG